MRISTINLPAFDPTEFLTKLGPHERFPVLMKRGRWTILAWNPSERFTGDRPEPIHSTLNRVMLKRRVRYGGQLPFVGGLIGYLSCDLGYALLGIDPTAKDRWQLPLLHAGLYEQAIVWDGKRLSLIGPKSFEREVREIADRAMIRCTLPPLHFKPSLSFAQYAARLRMIRTLIRDGDVYQLNSTYSYEAAFHGNDRQLFGTFLQKHPAPFAAYLESGACRLLSFSPERFLAIEHGHIRTCPVKGTRPRGATAAQDRQLRNELLKSPKERAELAMITDLLRNDVGRIARIGSVCVTNPRRIDATPSVWHTSSVIEAELASGLSPLDALFSMSPGGSVTGCPKKRAFQEIDRIEGSRRGPYTGTLFCLSDHGVLDSSILIRTLIHQGTRLSFGVGGGIVADSCVREEWQETKDKARILLFR